MLGGLRQSADATQIVVLDLSWQIRRLRKPKATGQLRCGDAPRQLQQGQRVAPRFPDDPVAH